MDSEKVHHRILTDGTVTMHSLRMDPDANPDPCTSLSLDIGTELNTNSDPNIKLILLIGTDPDPGMDSYLVTK